MSQDVWNLVKGFSKLKQQICFQQMVFASQGEKGRKRLSHSQDMQNQGALKYYGQK